MPATPPENKMSEKGRDVKKGHQGAGGEMVGSSDKNGIRFPVHDHHEHCDVRGSASKLKE